MFDTLKNSKLQIVAKFKVHLTIHFPNISTNLLDVKKYIPLYNVVMKLEMTFTNEGWSFGSWNQYNLISRYYARI